MIKLPLHDELVACRKCPRLVEWREQVALTRRASFIDQEYWGKAVPNFGDIEATHLIVGLAPAAHGANRTGRMFTGDRSGDWLYRALHKAGVANQASSDHSGDGLMLRGVMITAVCHCAPPDNKPTKEEIAKCRGYLDSIVHSRNWRGYLALGSLAWSELHKVLGVKAPKFGHCALSLAKPDVTVVGSYHPSQQNTFTGRLTEPMLDEAIARFLRSGSER